MPIPGAMKLSRLEENLGAAEIELTGDDMRDIETALTGFAVTGERPPEAVLKMSGL